MNDECRLAVLERYEKHYDQVWQGIEQGIEQGISCGRDAFFLMGPANYIFTTGGVR